MIINFNIISIFFMLFLISFFYISTIKEITDGVVSMRAVWSDKNFDCVIGALSATIYNDVIYFFSCYDHTLTTCKNALYEYNITGDSSVLLTPLTAINARRSMQMISTGLGLYVYGGRSASDCLADVWFYSFSDNRWDNAGKGPGKRCSYNAMKNGDDLLIYAGYYEDHGVKVINSELWCYLVSE